MAMTCIATDGITMAGDGLEESDGIIVGLKAVKVFHAKDGSVVGCSGNSGAIAVVRKWFEAGCPKDDIPDVREAKDDPYGPFNILILRRNRLVEYMDWNFVPAPCEVPATLGSGRDYARAAILLGHSPREAVAFAAEHCTAVGGQIVELTPRKKK
jgi:hypothetical protein